MSIAAEVPPEEIPVAGPPLPLGRRLRLEGRGTTFYREVPGPPGAPTVLLLHGWMASGGLNWFNVFEPLGEHFRVVAPDLRGHGRGIRSSRRFRIADCADDVAALCAELDTGPVIAVGYSMGGPVAQLLWRRHPARVGGLVLCATGDRFVPGVRERLVFGTLMATAAGTTRLGTAATKMPFDAARRIMPTMPARRPTDLRQWAAAEMRRHHWRSVLEAGQAIGSYSARRWIKRVDVPTAVVVTTQDRAVPPGVQLRMALAIPNASIHRLEDGHVACVRSPYTEVLLRACHDVHRRLTPTA